MSIKELIELFLSGLGAINQAVAEHRAESAEKRLEDARRIAKDARERANKWKEPNDGK